MVTPAARREAVAHLRSSFEVSERRACEALGADRTSVRYRSRRPDDAALRVRLRELARHPPPVRLSPPACSDPSRGHHHEPQEVAAPLSRGTAAGPPARRTQTGARHAGSDGVSAGTEPALEPGFPDRTPSPKADASASWRSSTTSPANAWRWWPTPRCRACGSCASSMPSSRARGRPAMMRLRQRHRAYQHGDPALVARRRGSSGTTSRPASRSRTPSSRASTDGCATNYSTRRCSPHSLRPAKCWPIWKDDYNTVRPHSALGNLPPVDLCRAQRSRNATGRGAALRRGLRAPPRCIHRAIKAQMKPGLYSSAG